MNPYIEYWDNGNKKTEIYRNSDGKFHRVDGSAYTEWNKDGNKFIENYYINGKLHREDGPAIIFYNKSGFIYIEYFYINGSIVSIEYFQSLGYKVNKCKKCNKTYFTKDP